MTDRTAAQPIASSRAGVLQALNQARTVADVAECVLLMRRDNGELHVFTSVQNCGDARCTPGQHEFALLTIGLHAQVRRMPMSWHLNPRRNPAVLLRAVAVVGWILFALQLYSWTR